jgi:hypothetical protein
LSDGNNIFWIDPFQAEDIARKPFPNPPLGYSIEAKGKVNLASSKAKVLYSKHSNLKSIIPVWKEDSYCLSFGVIGLGLFLVREQRFPKMWEGYRVVVQEYRSCPCSSDKSFYGHFGWIPSLGRQQY